MTQNDRGPGRPRSADVDAAILQAALDLMIERGIEATSIERVAQRAGVTRATIYRRFPDKIQLLIAAIQAGYNVPDQLPEVRDVEEMLSHWAEAISNPRGRRLIRRLITAPHDYPELWEAYRDASVKHREQAIRTVLERARDRGQFPPDADLEVIQHILTGAVAAHITAYPDTSTTQDIKTYLLAVLRHTNYQSRP